MTRTVEAFAEVTNLKENVPFFRLKVEPHDRPDVRWLHEGFFSFSSTNGNLCPVVVDPSLVFGPDTAYLRPYPFLENGRIPLARQLTSNILPSCLFSFSVALRPDETKEWVSFFGFAKGVEEANQFRTHVVGDRSYFHRKREEMKNVYSDLVGHFGFVSGEMKNKLLREADLFCFPTYYENENQPVNLIEAMAFGLPILTTRWRSLPELFPADYPGLVDIRSPDQIANVMPALMTGEAGDGFREIFLRNYTLQNHLHALADAFKSLESPEPAVLPADMRTVQSS